MLALYLDMNDTLSSLSTCNQHFELQCYYITTSLFNIDHNIIIIILFLTTKFILVSQYKHVFFYFHKIGNLAKGVSTIPDSVLDQQPPILEITTQAKTAEWNQLGVQLELNDVTLAGSHDYTKMYQLWIMEKAENATQRKLISALRAIQQNNLAYKYEQHLKTVSI